MLTIQAIFIDGTEIEANANRYTFVWRRAVEKHHAALTVQELEQITARLEETIESINEEISSTKDVDERKRLRAERKKPRHLRKQAADFAARKRRYEEHMVTFGTRNSYSKTGALYVRLASDVEGTGFWISEGQFGFHPLLRQGKTAYET